MKISSSLAQLNFDRFVPDKPSNVTTQAIYSFKGDTYVGLKAENFTKDDIISLKSTLAYYFRGYMGY